MYHLEIIIEEIFINDDYFKPEMPFRTLIIIDFNKKNTRTKFEAMQSNRWQEC